MTHEEAIEKWKSFGDDFDAAYAGLNAMPITERTLMLLVAFSSLPEYSGLILSQPKWVDYIKESRLHFDTLSAALKKQLLMASFQGTQQ